MSGISQKVKPLLWQQCTIYISLFCLKSWKEKLCLFYQQLNTMKLGLKQTRGFPLSWEFCDVISSSHVALSITSPGMRHEGWNFSLNNSTLDYVANNSVFLFSGLDKTFQNKISWIRRYQWMRNGSSRADPYLSVDGSVTSGGSRICLKGVLQLPKSYYFANILPKTAWKWNNLNPQGACPLRSANGHCRERLGVRGRSRIPCRRGSNPPGGGTNLWYC